MSGFALLYMFYGLAFFCMGLVVMLEVGRGTDLRLKHALRPLAIFGLVHGVHEWFEMFLTLGLLDIFTREPLLWDSLRIGMLATSFLALTAFGSSLLAPDERRRRLSLLTPLAQAGLWGFGMLVLRDRYVATPDLWAVADVWSRYVLGVPSALIASVGLIALQRTFRQAGMEQFGRDSLWAAVAFAWYGSVGQIFTQVSPLAPSNVINQELFLELFGFPVQIIRALAAIVSAVFVIRFMRAFEVAIQRQIAELQQGQLVEAQRREALRGDLLKRVVQAQESERQRIARELHDETGQALTAIGLGIKGIQGLIPETAEKAQNNLRNLERLTGHSLNELQRLISDLRPSHLDDLGLPAALRWYVGNLQNLNDLQIKVTIKGIPKTIPSEVQTTLFRVAQEALTNTIRHAHAANARVLLSFAETDVRLLIEDDGSGFDPRMIRNPNRKTWGLLGMEERAALLGGKLKLQSHPGGGTRIEVRIPYDFQGRGNDEDPTAAGR